VPLPTMCHYHSTLTLRYVNSSLESVEGQLADGTLAAMACLAAFEVINTCYFKGSIRISSLQSANCQ
jgi:hypothetical protein